METYRLTRYDLLIYYRDNLIASSGTVGDWIDIAMIPSFLGVELPDRLQKWIAYKKQGLGLLDSSQEGVAMNTIFNGYDDTVKSQSIEAIQIAIASIETQVTSITGVTKQQLGNIEERDAVSNVKYGARQSSLLTKQYFHALDLIYKEINYDLLNLAKIAYKSGIKGTIILGDRLSKIFTALPEHYTMTDFDIHIEDSSEMFHAKEEIKNLNIELIRGNLIDAEDAINVVTARNVTSLKRIISNSIAAKKAENNMIDQLQQQLDQSQQQLTDLNKQLNQLQNENKQLQQQVEANNQLKLQIEREKVQVMNKEAEDKDSYNDQLLKLKNRQLDIELLQIRDGNPYNDQIKDV